MIGTTLGHYEIVGKLGHGGMGEVYRARDSKLRREVALKVLDATVAGDPERLDRFRREAETVARLNHPNIVTIFSVEEDDGVHFITMELVEGRTLDKLTPSDGLSLERIFDLAIPFADALAAAHEKGIIHRDLKPANVMVNEEGRVKVLDFGLAKALDDGGEPGGDLDVTQALTEEGKVLGTMPYMAPEQVQGRPLDRRSDIFSMGIMLHEMATGARPFKGDSSADLISSILRDKPESVTDSKVELPHHLGRIISHCLEKDPSRRYQAALDVRNELEALKREVDSGVVQTETAVVESESAAPPAARARRWPLVAGAAAVAVALLVGWLVMGRDGERAGAPVVGEEATAERSSIAVLYFDNLSGDPELDWLRSGLTDMLVTDLSQSPDLRILSTDRLYQILADMKKLDERITSFEVVREVADRAGAATVVLGSFAKLGDTIRISIKAQEAATGEILQARSVDAREQEEIFARIDELSRGVRESVEPPERAVTVADRDLSDVSTDSVLAYRRYVEAEKLHYQSREREAAELYKEAVEIDPSFAMAWAKLSTVHGNMRMPERSREYAEKAMEHLDRLSEPERAYVEGRYYGQSLDTMDRAMETYAAALERYPHLTAIANNLGIIYANFWMFDEAIGAYEQAIEYGDRFPGTYHSLASLYPQRGETERGFRLLDEFLERQPESFSTHLSKAGLHLLVGELDAAEAALDRVDELQPGYVGTISLRYQLATLREDWAAAEAAAREFGELPFPTATAGMLSFQANHALYRGRGSEAIAKAVEAIEVYPGPGPNRGQSHLMASVLNLQQHEYEDALAHARAARADDPDGIIDFVGLAFEAFAQQGLGRERLADLLVEELAERASEFPGGPTRELVPEARGWLAILRGRAEEAIRELERARGMLPRYDNNAPRVHFVLGEAYEAAGRAADAEASYRRVIEYGLVRLFAPLEYVRAHYRLGRIHEERGENDAARELYQAFVEYWGDGEMDRDEVADAREFLRQPAA